MDQTSIYLRISTYMYKFYSIHKVLTREFISIEKMEVKPHYTQIKSEINVLDNIHTIFRKRLFQYLLADFIFLCFYLFLYVTTILLGLNHHKKKA